MTTPTPEEQAAVDEALEAVTLGITSPTGAEAGEGTVQVLVRVPAGSRDRWKAAAEAKGVTLSEFVRSCCDQHASELLDCQHPIASLKTLPWATICKACGKRLWENPRTPHRGPGRV
jgi:uncharacterized protein (DUF1778 family)